MSLHSRDSDHANEHLQARFGVRGPRDWIAAFSRLEKEIKFVNIECKATQIETRFVIQLLVAWLKDSQAWFVVFLENRSSRVGRRVASTLDYTQET